ncbi:TadE/TadG family type IV pilus assembly protein [Yoonia sp.]|uniref:TadE/TadG family type IV pilus assembly protein n=1 Tax=Yoonia sp. TaxID=2212373 RepID=UPI0025F2510A|nr:TadE/TadG family type IV pilus assembly protein [Yoonia sp.]
MKRFRASEDGNVTIEFVLVFPVFMLFFLMTYESGIMSLRHVMLERGVDIAVRDVRIGTIANPTRENLRDRICEVAAIIPDCTNQLELEMVRRNPRSWTQMSNVIRCIDRDAEVQPVVQFTNGTSNELLILRVCARFDPVLPTTGLGKAVAESNDNPAAKGSYALVTTAAFVIEPFQ